jgi:hypothetical protein
MYSFEWVTSLRDDLENKYQEKIQHALSIYDTYASHRQNEPLGIQLCAKPYVFLEEFEEWIGSSDMSIIFFDSN